MSIISEIINQSSSIYKDNIREVICILMKNSDFMVFFINIIIDFRIGSLDESELVAFFSNYEFIDTAKPADDVAKELHLQLQNHFGSLILKSRFNSSPSERHINIIPYETFHAEHLPDTVAASVNDIR